MGVFDGVISAAVLQLSEDGTDELIESDIGEICTLVYPPILVDCPSCDADAIGNKSGSFSLHGMPIPVPGISGCVMCNGTSKIEQEVTDEVRGLVTWKLGRADAQWIEQTPNVQIADGTILLYTYFSNQPKIMRAKKIKVAQRTQPGHTYTYEVAGDAFPRGFRDKYLLVILKRVP